MFQIERFKKLIAAVEKAPPERFDMLDWAKETDCGTVACAAGWYVLENPDCGLKLVNFGFGDVTIHLFDEDCRMGAAALGDHFEIDDTEANHLFKPDCYRADYRELAKNPITKEEVLTRLRDFLENQPIPVE